MSSVPFGAEIGVRLEVQLNCGQVARCFVFFRREELFGKPTWRFIGGDTGELPRFSGLAYAVNISVFEKDDQ